MGTVSGNISLTIKYWLLVGREILKAIWEFISQHFAVAGLLTILTALVQWWWMQSMSAQFPEIKLTISEIVGDQVFFTLPILVLLVLVLVWYVFFLPAKLWSNLNTELQKLRDEYDRLNLQLHTLKQGESPPDMTSSEVVQYLYKNQYCSSVVEVHTILKEAAYQGRLRVFATHNMNYRKYFFGGKLSLPKDVAYLEVQKDVFSDHSFSFDNEGEQGVELKPLEPIEPSKFGYVKFRRVEIEALWSPTEPETDD